MCIKSKFKTLQEARRLFQEPEVADPEELEVIKLLRRVGISYSKFI